MVGVSVNASGSAATIPVNGGSYYGAVERKSANEQLGFFDTANLVLATRDASNVSTYTFYPVLPAVIWDLSQICPNFYQ